MNYVPQNQRSSLLTEFWVVRSFLNSETARRRSVQTQVVAVVAVFLTRAIDWRLTSNHSHHQLWPSAFHVHFQATGMEERLRLRFGMIVTAPSVKKRLRAKVRVRTSWRTEDCTDRSCLQNWQVSAALRAAADLQAFEPFL